MTCQRPGCTNEISPLRRKYCSRKCGKMVNDGDRDRIDNIDWGKPISPVPGTVAGDDAILRSISPGCADIMARARARNNAGDDVASPPASPSGAELRKMVMDGGEALAADQELLRRIEAQERLKACNESGLAGRPHDKTTRRVTRRFNMQQFIEDDGFQF